MQLDGSPPADRDERPVKRTRGRPKSSTSRPSDSNPVKQKSREAPAPKVDDTAPKKTGKRGRPKGSRTSGESAAQNVAEENEAGNAHIGKAESIGNSNDELDAPQNLSKSTRSKTAPKATRGRKKAANRLETDGEFEYTPTNPRRFKSLETEQTQPPANDQEQLEDTIPETQKFVEESILPDEPAPPRSLSASPSKAGYNRLVPLAMGSPSKAGEPELRRRIGDLTKKYDNLEGRYNRLREVGIIQANANVEKLQKHCETITEGIVHRTPISTTLVNFSDSNNLLKALRDELEAQRALGKQTRTLQKQLQERDGEVAKLKAQAEDATTQLSSSQTEAKALQTKLAAARNTASTIENAAAKGPISAKNTPANRAQSAEAAQAVQLAQLKEEFYTDLTGLIIRDVKERESDNLYDCIQTGVNGSEFSLRVWSITNHHSASLQTGRPACRFGRLQLGGV